MLLKCGALLLLFFLNVFVTSTSFQCVDENDEGVDWFVLYKLPKMRRHPNSLVQKGVAYTYMTSRNYSSWKLSMLSINDSNSMIAKTLKPLYSSDKNNYAYIVYNDQPPKEHSISTKGHNKGVIWTNSTGGFWMVHSVPHFPFPESVYEFPDTGIVYGQSFLCLSVDVKNVNEVGLQLQYNEPEIYFQNVPNELGSKVPQLAKASNNVTVTSPPWYRRTNVTTRNGINFTSFAKSKEFNKDLYEDWVAPALQTNLFVETWPNGPGKLASNCSKPFKVFNVKSVTIKTLGVTFTNTHDHSKWAVSELSNGTNWICIGDINRMEHQKSRGGGTVCLDNKILANDYQKCVTSIEKCNN